MSEQTQLTVPGAVPLPPVASRSLATYAEPALIGLAGLLLASVVAAADGGYFSDSWAWLAFVSLVVATLRLILVPALPLRRLDWAFVAGLGAFAGWVARSLRPWYSFEAHAHAMARSVVAAASGGACGHPPNEACSSPFRGVCGHSILPSLGCGWSRPPPRPARNPLRPT